MSVAKAARQASFRPTCSPNRGWIILFEPPPSPLSAPAPPSLPLSSSSSSSSQELWRIFFHSFFFKNKICFLLGKKRQPWDALPPGWDGFMMCCQLAEGARERMRKHSKHVFLLPTIIWGEEGRKKGNSAGYFFIIFLTEKNERKKTSSWWGEFTAAGSKTSPYLFCEQKKRRTVKLFIRQCES